jgi:hypothetical protein
MYVFSQFLCSWIVPVSCGYDGLILFCNFINSLIVRAAGFKSKNVHFWSKIEMYTSAIFFYFSTVSNNMSDVQNFETGK